MAEVSEERRQEVAERAANNAPVIEKYRATGGADSNVVLLHHTGAKSGIERVSPLAYRAAGDSIAVFGSNGARPANPDWYYNLVAHPDTVIELGGETFPVRARVASGAERAEIWEEQKAAVPAFAEYEKKAPREIPVVILDRV
jgi:deazaflavin-dependent oxidoreductase (nitroreductase family)